MNHWTARRQLSGVLDGSLPAPVEARVRAHVRACARCRGALRELSALDRMLRRMPRRLVPAEGGAEAERRLAALARWAPEAPRRRGHPGRWSASALGAAAAAAAVLALRLSVGVPAEVHEPPRAQPEQWIALAGAPADAGAIALTGWR